jgi:hypothetical protein
MFRRRWNILVTLVTLAASAATGAAIYLAGLTAQ